MTKPIRVVLAGINGRMGRLSSKIIDDDSDFVLTGAIGRPGSAYIGKDVGELTHGKKNDVLISEDAEAVLKDADVLLDFTVAAISVAHAKLALQYGVRPVIGTSGIGDSDIDDLMSLCADKETGGLVVPNFSVGAVVMMEFARQAGKFFENVEIVEMHHTRKLDAPSGTAMHTVKNLASTGTVFNRKEVDEHELLQGARGAAGMNGVRVHSLRLPGLISHQEVIFGSPGELLTIRHDSFNTDCFVSGIRLALNTVLGLTSLKVGLDKIMRWNDHAVVSEPIKLNR
jgi:4-hydroxy-tetrahydrodipicolinate reductase